MNKEETVSLVDGFYNKPRRSHDPDLLVIEAALFLEQALSIPLSDSDMTPGLAGSRDDLMNFITQRSASA